MTKGTHGEVYQLLGQRLRALRRQHGKTQAQVARLIDISPQQYQKYEDAQTKCSLTAIVALAGYYGVSIETIVDPLQTTSSLVVKSDQFMAPALSDESLQLGDQDLLSRLVAAYLRLPDHMEKMRVIELIEAMKVAHF